MEAEGVMTAAATQVPVDPRLEALHMALALESCADHTSEVQGNTTANGKGFFFCILPSESDRQPKKLDANIYVSDHLPNVGQARGRH